MPPTTQIRVDQEVREKLAELAKGFETPNKVLRRILELDPEPSHVGGSQ